MMAGGRWNPIGIPMLYTTKYLSLACLEVLVHLDKGQLPRDYVWSKTELPIRPRLLTSVTSPSVSHCQAAGEAWIMERGQVAAVRVPSVVLPVEFNILLNPRHEGYDSVRWSDPLPVHFDPRLFATEPHTL
jgi:RES domain-containing protein